jgi:enoyl-CoA hydratase/carnithine racemase
MLAVPVEFDPACLHSRFLIHVRVPFDRGDTARGSRPSVDSARFPEGVPNDRGRGAMRQASWPHCAAVMDARGVATLRIERSGVLNILGSSTVTDLTGALDELAGWDDLRVLVLRGTGDRAFIGGADIKEMAGLDRPGAEAFISRLHGLCEAVRRFPAPVIARLAGWTLGGGLEVAMACDLRVAADDAHFGMPEVKVGIPSVIHAALMGRQMGDGRARWLILTGENIGAAEALQGGLVGKVVPAAALDAEIERVCAALAEQGPQAMRIQKRLLRAFEEQPLAESTRGSIAAFGSAFETGEPQRYMGEFLRRKRH